MGVLWNLDCALRIFQNQNLVGVLIYLLQLEGLRLLQLKGLDSSSIF